MKVFLVAVAALVGADCWAGFGRSIYLDAMETAVGAYSDARIERYVAENARDGVAEHGFPRLAANIGILVAHGRQTSRTAMLRHMLEICFRDVGKAMRGKGGGNDFSVKELVLALRELERAAVFDKSVVNKWRAQMTAAIASTIYSVQPALGNKERAFNWCVYGAASEQARIAAGMGGDSAYVERYVSDQLRWFDDNGMYMDPNMPMVYDMVTRLQFAAILHLGYAGPSRDALVSQFVRGAGPTLAMQSVTGEIPYGGRSNQFLHNDTFYAALCEWYAAFFKSRGEIAVARRFRGAAKRAMDSLSAWTNQHPVRHVKNRYPSESGYGCEGYAYFDKYMVTMGSWAYLAYMFADDSIEPDATAKDCEFTTSDAFHRTIINRGGYTVQLDWNAQHGYDANGVGRIQRKNAPSVICLASPCPADAHYRMDVTNDIPFAIARIDGRIVRPEKVDENGVVFNCGEGSATMMLPALLTDGETESVIRCDGSRLTVSFKGWKCDYRTNGRISDTGKVYGNRNGHYRRYDVSADTGLRVEVAIYRD